MYYTHANLYELLVRQVYTEHHIYYTHANLYVCNTILFVFTSSPQRYCYIHCNKYHEYMIL